MMKLLVLVLAALTPAAAAKVWVTVYQHDGKTPLAAVDADHPNVFREIMVGTRLTLVLSSDSGEYWMGSLRLSWDDANDARLSGRGNATIPPRAVMRVPSYADSCLDAAGTRAVAYDRAEPEGIGLTFSNSTDSLIPGSHAAYPGDWFVVEYHAEQVGPCDVGLYGFSVDFRIPIQTLSLTHVPSRDFNGGTVVNFKDFAVLASHWRAAADPNSPLEAAVDLDADHRVGAADLASFSQYWLARTDSHEPPAPSGSTVKP